MAKTKYDEAITNYAQALKDALEIADDTFKAPEQVVLTTESVLKAIWDLQVEYAALLLVGRRERGED